MNLQMLDSNENKAKGARSLAEWTNSCEVDFEKQILPKNTDFNDFVEFVDERWGMLKEKLKRELSF